MSCCDENGGGEVMVVSMCWFYDIIFWEESLVVMDVGNNWVMVWDGIFIENN